MTWTVKNIVIAFNLVTASIALGNWQKIVSCNGDSTVVDVDMSERRNLQLVIRDRRIIQHFNDLNLWTSKWGDTEIVILGNTWDLNFDTGDIQWIKGVFYPQDFSSLVHKNNGSRDIYTQVVLEGNALLVKRFRQDKWNICQPFPYEGSCDIGGTFRFIQEYRINNCFRD